MHIHAGLRTALKDAQLARPRNLVAEAHTAAAVDTALGVQLHVGAQVPPAAEGFFLVEAAAVAPVGMHVVLQFAFPGPGADGAVERVVEQGELQHVCPGADHGLGLGLDHHAVHHGRVAGRGQRLLPPHFDLGQAQAAMRRRRQCRMEAEMRNVHPVHHGGQQQIAARFRFYFPAVQNDARHAHLL